MSRTSITSSDVGDLVERYLEKHQPSDYRILIDRNGIKAIDDDWWEVPIKPSNYDKPSYDWIGRSVQAAGEMDDAEGVHVLFT